MMNLQQLFAILLAIPMTFFAAGGAQNAAVYDLPEQSDTLMPVLSGAAEIGKNTETCTAAHTKRTAPKQGTLIGIVPAMSACSGTETICYPSGIVEPLPMTTFLCISGVTVRYERLSDGKAGM